MTTKDKIIALAKQAGIPFNKYGLVGCNTCETDIDDALEAFHRLALDAYRTELLVEAGEPVGMEPVAVVHEDDDGSQPYLKRLKHPLPTVGTKLYTAHQVAAIRLQERERMEADFNLLATDLETAVAENAILDAKCKESEKDAARYRWLRDNGTGGSNRKVWVGTQTGPVIAGHEFLDAAIDAAMKGSY